jgi:hypothetical protein
LILKGNKTIKILVFLFSITALITAITFTGCSKGLTSEQEIAVEEGADTKGGEIEAEEEIAEETTKEEDESQTAVDEITGNINKFSGFEISDTVEDSRPLAIMINNHPAARPQSGLIYADIVFEVEDEGGVTRYIAVYSSYDAEIVGPIRSARIYYAEIARSLDSIYVFFGTHKDSYANAYKVIENMGLDVLTTIGEPEPNIESSIVANASFWNDYSRSNSIEHCRIMSTLQLKDDAEKIGYSLEGGQSTLRFKEDAADSDRGDISDIIIDFSYDNFLAEFKYDRENNNYLKFLAGSPHNDRETGIQIAVKNIIVMFTDIAGPIDEKGHLVVRTYTTSDTIGKALFFMDGKVTEGTWERSSISDPFKYKDSEGNLVLFNRGLTWVAVIDEDRSSLTY